MRYESKAAMSERRKILIVDDEVQSKILLKRILERKRPYDVLVENDATKAVSIAQSFRPDLILLDMIMPDLDGEDVARAIRRTPAVQMIPIIFVSASARPVKGYPFLTN